MWRKRERRPLYITVGPGACTLMGETVKAVTSNMYQDLPNKARHLAYYDHVTRVVRTDDVDCMPLDEVIPAGETVDFLKLDARAQKLACMEGAERLLTRPRACSSAQSSSRSPTIASTTFSESSTCSSTTAATA